jgi:ABC-type transport system involved in multi-copper enzyme maturation permease subunit
LTQIYYIAKRNLQDILRSGVFWGAFIVAAFICFSMLFWGWQHMTVDMQNDQKRAEAFPRESEQAVNPDDQGNFDGNPFRDVDSKIVILYFTYLMTIDFAKLLAIFIMMGILSRDIENRRIDLLLARPVSRTQIYFGKLVAGWAALIVFLGGILAWTFICMALSHMEFQPKYAAAVAMGSVAPLLIATLVLLMSIWMRGVLAGLFGVIVTIGASTVGLSITYFLGVEILRLKTAVHILFKILPPLNVIGTEATSFLQRDMSLRMAREMFEQVMSGDTGLYTQMWQVWVYFGVVVILGWLSLFRRQFT